MNAPVTAVLFDAAGTLIHLPRSVGEHYREVAGRFEIDLSAQALNTAFAASWKSAPARPMTDGPRPDDDKGWWCELVRQVIATTATTAQRRALPFDDYFDELYTHFAKPGIWCTYPEVTEVLAQLQARGCKLGVVSNFDGRLRTVLRDLGLATFFSSVVISSEVGADKPDPKIFQKALAAIDADAAQTVHVGDDPRCDGGASAVGLRVFEVRRPDISLRDLIPWLDTAGRGQM